MNYPIEIIEKKINRKYLERFLNKPFKTVVKFAVDIKQGIMAVGGELHIDAAELLTQQKDSEGRHLWGGNFYLTKSKNKSIEYSSLINIKPSMGNYSLEIKDEIIKKTIEKVINKLIVW